MSSMTAAPPVAGSSEPIRLRQKRAALTVAMRRVGRGSGRSAARRPRASPVQFQAGGGFELSFLSRPETRHGRDVGRDPRVAVSVYSWPGPDDGNLGLQITGSAAPEGDAAGGWQRYTIRPVEVWCFDSRTDHERHRISIR